MMNPQTETVSVADWLDDTWELRPYNYVEEVTVHRPTIEAMQLQEPEDGGRLDLVSFREPVIEQIRVELTKLNALKEQLETLTPLNRSEELILLAKRAIGRSAEAKDEDIEEWASRLIIDIKGAAD
jgi:hypothetical protein